MYFIFLLFKSQLKQKTWQKCHAGKKDNFIYEYLQYHNSYSGSCCVKGKEPRNKMKNKTEDRLQKQTLSILTWQLRWVSDKQITYQIRLTVFNLFNPAITFVLKDWIMQQQIFTYIFYKWYFFSEGSNSLALIN